MSDPDGSNNNPDGGGDGGGDGMVPATPGFKITPTQGLQTGEDGKQATFKVSLTAAPTADVMIGVSSSDPGEGTVAPSMLTFTAASWNSEQTVTITGVNDDEQDGPIDYTILLAAAQSADARYQGMNPADVAVQNIDDDTAGFVLADNADVRVAESGTEDRFSVRLTTQPTANVTITLASSDTGEATVTPTALTFTSMNWNSPQFATVKGVDDNEADGNVQLTITTTATSTDQRYNGLAIPDVAVTVDDNDTAAFRVVPTSGLRTNENGRQDRFVVSLATRPAANVTIPVSSSDTTEATVSVTSLTFTRDNWNAVQTVIVTGVNDDLEDRTQPFTIALGAATSTDARYMGLDPADVTGSNVDNDTAGITLDGEEDLAVSEAGGQATFTVVLNKAPTATVTIAVTTSDATEATVAPASLVFTTSNWNSPQTVTVTGQDDADQDGAQQATIRLAQPVSDDEDYAELTEITVPVTVTDNETAGIAVSTPEPFETNESGAQTSFTVALTARPASNVTIPVSSSVPSEITIAPASLVFTAANWNAPQSVTLTGVDDNVIDGNQPVLILLGAATSSDPSYQGKDADDPLAINVDNDTAGVTITPSVGIATSESGTQSTFTVRLNTRPSNNVTFTVAVPDATEGTISASSLTFTADNWNAPQDLTLTGVDDAVADGNQEYLVVFGAGVSDDVRYSGLVVPNLVVVNNDNDTPGVEFLDAENLVTTEAPGGTATFRARLRSQPTGNVTLNIASSNTAEGTVLPATLTFTPANWNAAQPITVTGVDDLIADGLQVYQVTFTLSSTADTRYNGLPVGNVVVSNTDNDTPNVIVTPAVSPMRVRESGTQTTFTVRLQTQPTQPVTIPIASSDTGEVTLSPASVTFDQNDWNSVKTVTLTGVGDLLQDGNQEVNIVFGPIAGDPRYAALTVPNETVTNQDTDGPGINVILTGPLATREDGSQTSFRVSLAREPTSPVSLPIFVIEGDEARVISVPITFDANDFASEKTVVIEGRNDDIADGTQPFRVQVGPAESMDPSYAGRLVPLLDGTNGDNDSPGVIVTPVTSLSVTEGGATDQFTVSLASEPVGTVTIPVNVLDPTQVNANVATLTFTNANWNSAIPVTVTAVNDLVADATQPFNIALGPTQATASDLNYQGIVIPNVTGLATDNDVAGLEVDPNVFNPPVADLLTTENGGDDTFRVRLTSQPTAPVTINVASTVLREGTVSPASVTVQPADFANWVTFTVTGANDDIADGQQAYAITIASNSNDPNYNRTTPNIPVLNADNDTRGINLSTTSLPATSESGLPAQTFTLVLTSQPLDNVVIGIAPNDAGELAVSSNSLTFTPANWNVAQTVTVTGVDEFIADGHQPRRVDIAAAVSTDPNYNGLTVTNQGVAYVEITNNDNDTASIAVPDDDAEVYDQPSTDSFTIRLTSQPLVDVVIPLINDDPSEVTISPTSLTFTAANWNQPQTVTVTSIEDGVRDGDQVFFIRTGNAVAVGDNNYNGMDGPDVEVTTFDAGTSCRTIKVAGPALGNGMYVLDPDLKGPIARFNAYCDMTTVRGTETGGWTLLAWSRNTDPRSPLVTRAGVPYPGLFQCGNANFALCNRGTGVPTDALEALFATSTELAQGQTRTETAVMGIMAGFVPLANYEWAGSYVYPTLADLSIGPAASCSVLTTGTFRAISGAATTAWDGTTVYLNQSLASGLAAADPVSLLDYSSDAATYRYSLGSTVNTCAVNGVPPNSFLGTWESVGEQVGPNDRGAGAYSVWVR